MKTKFAAATMLLGMIVLGLAACTPGGGAGAGASMLEMIPAGDYDGMFAFKPGELFESEFIKNLTDAFPLFSLIKSQMMSQMGETAVDIEKLDMILVAGSMENQLAIIKADWAEDDLVTEYQDNKGVELTKAEYNGMSYWYDEVNSTAMVHIGDAYVTGSEENVKKAIDLNAGIGDRYVDSEAFKAAQKYVDLGSTFTFFTSDMKKMDLEEMKQQLAAEGEDEATIEMVSGAMQNLEAVGGGFKITNAIAGDVAMVFADEASSKTFYEFAEKKMKKAFEDAADSLENMGQMMNLNADREKFMKLAEKITLSQSGSDMIVKVNIAWADLAFLFETPAE